MKAEKVDMDSYYRQGVFRHFSEDAKCSVSMTSRVDVTDFYAYSKKKGTSFYINFVYLIAKVLNSREDYRHGYDWINEEMLTYEKINPTQYIFHEDTETFTVAYTEYNEDYEEFYRACDADAKAAAATREYGLDLIGHPNWFDASYIPWVSYDSLNVELPDGHLFFAPVINWGRFREENGRRIMPLTVRLNHAVADGYLLAKVYYLLEKEMKAFVDRA